MVTKELGNLGAVGRVLVDSELEVLGEGLVKLLVGILVLGKVVEHLNALLDEILLDDTKNLVLLESFTRNVERKILRVNNSSNKLQPFRHQVLAVVHDKDTTDVELNVVELLLVSTLKHVKWSALWSKEDGTEFELTLNGKVLDGGMLFPVVAHGLVKGNVFVLGDIVRLAHPDWLLVVEVFPLVANLLDLLHLLLLFGLVLIDFFDLWLVVVVFFFVLIIIIVVIWDLLLGGLLSVQLDWESNKLRVLLDKVLDTLFFKVFRHVFLEVKNDTSTASKGRVLILGDGERTTSL
mmetsp:Transcript_17079/g.28363  ORF Transcript_17079/g.28363 Transcript_17079/m.28363 type:complete len:293 (-) Transcript_17079:561-1439(-)